MSKKKSEKELHASQPAEFFEEQWSVASATECTGLIPTPPEDLPEKDAYREIYNIPLPDSKKNAKESAREK